MSTQKRIAGSGAVRENWGPAMKESGLDVVTVKTMQEAIDANVDGMLVDMRDPKWVLELSKMKTQTRFPMVSVVSKDVNRHDLELLRNANHGGVVGDHTPPEELVVRLRALLNELPEENTSPESKELRTSRRVWFQQETEFQVFDRKYKAWSTTLSETGIFLRTSLSFPLYSVIRLQFHLLGDSRLVECEGVIVRQEVEQPIRGLGIMFQNLNGETLRRIESFLELYR